MENKKTQLINRIENDINEVVSYSKQFPAAKFSTYLGRKMNYDFTYKDMANLFTETELLTIDQFILIQKIEYVKALLTGNNLTLAEIAAKLHYANIAKLTIQFKKITGITPSFFRMIRHKEFITLKMGKITF